MFSKLLTLFTGRQDGQSSGGSSVDPSPGRRVEHCGHVENESVSIPFTDNEPSDEGPSKLDRSPSIDSNISDGIRSDSSVHTDKYITASEDDDDECQDTHNAGKHMEEGRHCRIENARSLVSGKGGSASTLGVKNGSTQAEIQVHERVNKEISLPLSRQTNDDDDDNVRIEQTDDNDMSPRENVEDHTLRVQQLGNAEDSKSVLNTKDNDNFISVNNGAGSDHEDTVDNDQRSDKEHVDDLFLTNSTISDTAEKFQVSPSSLGVKPKRPKGESPSELVSKPVVSEHGKSMASTWSGPSAFTKNSFSDNKMLFSDSFQLSKKSSDGMNQYLEEYQRRNRQKTSSPDATETSSNTSSSTSIMNEMFKATGFTQERSKPAVGKLSTVEAGGSPTSERSLSPARFDTTGQVSMLGESFRKRTKAVAVHIVRRKFKKRRTTAEVDNRIKYIFPPDDEKESVSLYEQSCGIETDREKERPTPVQSSSLLQQRPLLKTYGLKTRRTEHTSDKRRLLSTSETSMKGDVVRSPSPPENPPVVESHIPNVSTNTVIGESPQIGEVKLEGCDSNSSQGVFEWRDSSDSESNTSVELTDESDTEARTRSPVIVLENREGDSSEHDTSRETPSTYKDNKSSSWSLPGYKNEDETENKYNEVVVDEIENDFVNDFVTGFSSVKDRKRCKTSRSEITNDGIYSESAHFNTPIVGFDKPVPEGKQPRLLQTITTDEKDESLCQEIARGARRKTTVANRALASDDDCDEKDEVILSYSAEQIEEGEQYENAHQRSEVLETRRIFQVLFHDDPRKFTMPGKDEAGFRRMKILSAADNRKVVADELRDCENEKTLEDISDSSRDGVAESESAMPDPDDDHSLPVSSSEDNDDSSEHERQSGRVLRRKVTADYDDNRLKNNPGWNDVHQMNGDMNIKIRPEREPEWKTRQVETEKEPKKKIEKTEIKGPEVKEELVTEPVETSVEIDVLHDATYWIDKANEELEAGRKSGLQKSRGGPDCALILDVSSSMRGTPLSQVMSTAKEFIEGVGTLAETIGLEENVGIVVMGNDTKVVKHMTDDYIELLTCLSKIHPGGPSPLAGALFFALAVVGANAERRRHTILSRVIVLSDGRVTPNRVRRGSDEQLEQPLFRLLDAEIPLEMQAVVSQYKERRIPIYCIPFGKQNDTYLEMMTKETRGEIIPKENLRQLINMQRNRVQGYDLAKSQNTRAIGYDAIRPQLEMHFLLRGMLMPREDVDEIIKYAKEYDEGEDSDDDEAYFISRDVNHPAVGSRVRRGRDWSGGNEDDDGMGTIVSHRKDGYMWVKWDTDERNKYQCGRNFCYEIEVTDEPRVPRADEMIATGCLVQRGPDWDPKNETDGGAGSLGVVLHPSIDGTVIVSWSNRNLNTYSHGANGMFEVEVCKREKMPETFCKRGGSVSKRPTKSATNIMSLYEEEDNKDGKEDDKEPTIEEMNRKNQRLMATTREEQMPRPRRNNKPHTQRNNSTQSAPTESFSLSGDKSQTKVPPYIASDTDKQSTSSDRGSIEQDKCNGVNKSSEPSDNCNGKVNGSKANEDAIQQQNATCAVSYIWQYRTGKEEWTNYDEENNGKIDGAFSRGDRSVVIVKDGKRSRIIFPKMSEHDSVNGELIEIRKTLWRTISPASNDGHNLTSDLQIRL